MFQNHTNTQKYANAPANVHAQEIQELAKGHCFGRKLRFAQLRILTITPHVIAVSAQQRHNETGVRCIRRRSGSAAGVFLIIFSFYSLSTIDACY